MVEFSGREGVDPQMADDVKTVLEEAGVSREVFDADTDGAKTSGGGNSGGRGLPLPSPVAYRLTTVEPGLKQMLTVRRPSFKWSLKLRLLQKFRMEIASLLQGMPDSPKSGQHRGFPGKTWGRGADDIPSASFMDTVRPL